MTYFAIRQLAESVAREDALKDLAFTGNDVINKLPITEADKQRLRDGLVYYAETGAVRAVAALKLHGVIHE